MAKQYDSGIHDQQVSKAQEAVSFNDTFDTSPVVFVTSYSTTAPGKGTGASSITTTGFDCYGENIGDHGWVARETGFEEGSSSSSSSSTSSSSSSSSSLSSSSSSSALPWNCPIDYRIVVGTKTSSQLIPDFCINDGTALCVAEVGGVPGFNIEFDFVSVPDTTGVYHFEIIYSYIGSAGHRIKLQGWNYNTLAWENFDISLTDFVNTGGALALALVNVGVGEEVNDFISGGDMLVRIYHITSGNTNHIFCVDQMILVEGFEVSSSSSSSSESSSSLSSSSSSSSSESSSSSSSSSSSRSSSSSSSSRSSSSSSSSAIPWPYPVQWSLPEGTLVQGGVVEDVWYHDTTNLICIQEVVTAPAFDMRFFYEGVPFDDATSTIHIDCWFSYDAEDSAIKVQVWNFDTTSWDNITTNATDFPITGGVIAKALFNIDGLEPYIQDGDLWLRIYHPGGGEIDETFCLDKFILQEGAEFSSSSSSSSRSSSSSSSSSLSSSSSSSSSSLSSSSSSSSTAPGTVVYGHHTAVSEDYDEDFTGNWTTTSGWTINGTPGSDNETIDSTTCSSISISDPWYLGSMTAIVRVDKYQTGSGPAPVIHYKTAATSAGLGALSWTLYDGVSFTSLGWIQLRITHI